MRILLLILLASSFLAHGQCLTDFTKLTPETSPDYSLDFGRSISMHSDYLAVGVPNSDSVGRITGLVYIYKKQGAQWIKNAAIVPEVAIDGLQFGWSVKISQDYLFISAYAAGGSVYVYKKNSSDWKNPVVLAIWKVPNARYFGTSPNDPVSISADQNTVAITDIWHFDNSFPHESSGAIFLYHKNAGDEWSNGTTRTLIPPPETDVDDFGGGGVQFQGSRMATFTQFAPTASGRLYVYKDESGALDNFQLEAKLWVGELDYSYGFGINNFAFTEDGIFTMGSVDIGTPNAKWNVVFFEQPETGPWGDGHLTCHFDANESVEPYYWEPNIFATDGKDLLLTSRNEDGKSFLTRLKKGSNGWCDPIYETIEQNLPQPGITQRFGIVLAANQNLDAVVGFVSRPDGGKTQIALKTFARTAGAWDSEYLYIDKKTTAGHNYGRNILGVGDNLFVSAPYDGSVKANAGAVYVYTKNGAGWVKSGKILPPAGGQYDDVFASNIATNGDYLAVAAAGHSPSGKFFVYRKGTDWSTHQLIQEVDLTSDGLIVFVSGDHIAMSKDWLVIPYMDSGSSGGMDECHIFLAFYKFDGSLFQFHQSLCLYGSYFFARSSTVPVSIEDNVIVAGAKILELNAAGNWEVKHQLYHSDPERIQFSPDFTVVTNGDRFGFANYISNGTIFISAPSRDYNGTWDVGAVYVYAKRPDEEWSSRTESAKIIPHNKIESGLFGFSLAALHNTLIVGSPGNDFYRTGQAINKPGLASVFQARDFYWTNTEWIVDFSGDSFVKDYFGMAVHLDETDFFMGAPIEDLETGKISGSVYVVPTPPIVKLVPPVCFSDQSFELLGFPFHGVWSGPGITDHTKAIFNPALVGAGSYIITYTTPNCANTGLLQIEVIDKPLTVLPEGNDYLVCPGTNAIAIRLEVEAEPDVSYQWYYRESINNTFTTQGIVGSSMIATKRGEYQVKANNGVCSSFSPVMHIYDEQVSLKTEVPTPGCNNSNAAIQLDATPAGGTWSGSGVFNNRFNPFRLSPGDYLLTYRYTSALGCQYNETTVAKVIVPYKPQLSKVGNICVDGEVTVSLTPRGTDPASIIWMKRESTETGFTTIQTSGNSVTVRENSTVKVITETTYCLPEEVSTVINDSFSSNIFPSETNLEFCPDDDTKIIVNSSLPGSLVTWKFFEESITDASTIGLSGAELRPVKTGYYYASVTHGGCVVKTSPRHVLILPGDTLLIPNVFTPNGDGKNDLFRIFSNDPSPSYEIFNRYGVSVFKDSKNVGWNGGDFPSGVYFWYAVVANCRGVLKTYKGNVHLLR